MECRRDGLAPAAQIRLHVCRAPTNLMELPIEISVQEVAQLKNDQADVYILDCRMPDEYAVAAMDGTTLIPMNELQARISELADHKDRRIVVHCHLGVRSLHVAQWLRHSGFEKAQSMAGGIEAWSLEIDPAVPRY